MAQWSILPEELIQMISSHLELEDFLNCSLACKHWRNALNSHWSGYWRKKCQTKFFSKKLSSADKDFQVNAYSKMSFCSELAEMVPWKWKFIRENLVYSNWIEKGFKSENLGYLQIIYPLIQISCNGKFLAYPILRALNIIKLTKDLTKIQTLVHIKDMNVLYFGIAGSVFVYVENDKVFVYWLSDTGCDLWRQTRLKDDIESYSTSRAIGPNKKFAFELNTPHPVAAFNHNDKYFVSLACEKCERKNQNTSILYIWELSSGLKKMYFFKLPFPIKNQRVRLEGDTIWMLFTSYERRLIFLRYDFLSRSIKRVCSSKSLIRVHMCLQNIILVQNDNILFRDKQTGNVLATFEVESEYDLLDIKSCHPYCIHLHAGELGMVKVFDMETFTVEKIYLSDVVTSAHFLNPKANLVLFGIGRSRRINMQIWDIRKCVVLKHLGPSLGIIYTSWSKIVYMNVCNELVQLTLDTDVDLIKPEPKKREYFALNDSDEVDDAKPKMLKSE